MRLPGLRLPRPQVSLDWLGALGGRTTFLYIGYTTVLFVAFLLLTFPHELLVRRALSSVNTGAVDVDFKAVNFAWFNGYEITGTSVAALANEGSPYLECSRLWVRPSFGALVRGNPYDLLVSAELYGGKVVGEITLNGDKTAGNLELRELDLGRYRTLTSLLEEGQIAGHLSGQLLFEAPAGNLNAGNASGQFNLDGGNLAGAKIGGFPIPDLRQRQTTLKFLVRNGHLEVQELQTTGDLNAQASGQIVLRNPLEESVLNLRATIATSLETPDAIKGAIALIPRAPGAKPDAPITVTGTLARPRLR